MPVMSWASLCPVSEISCFTTCVVMKGCRANVRIVTPDDDNVVVDIDA